MDAYLKCLTLITLYYDPFNHHNTINLYGASSLQSTVNTMYVSIDRMTATRHMLETQIMEMKQSLEQMANGENMGQ